MMTTPTNSEPDEICFLYEKSKDEDKEPPVYYTVDSDDNTAGPSNSPKKGSKKQIIVVIQPKKTDKIDSNESDMEVDTFSEKEGESDNNSVCKDDVDESLSYKYPFEYLRQYCLKCDRLITRHKNLTTKICMTCATPMLYDCVVCHRKYKSKSNVFSHLKTKYDCRTKPDLHCSQCDYTNIHKGFMKNHIAKKHGGGVDDLISCTKCGRHFKRAYNAEEHELSCGTTPYLECLYCDFKTTYMISLKIHKNNHILDPEKGAALIDENFKEVLVDPLMDHPYNWTTDIPIAERKKIVKHNTSNEAVTPQQKIIDLNCRNMIQMYCYKCRDVELIKTHKEQNCKKCQTELLHQCGMCGSKFNNYKNIIRHFEDRHRDDNLMDTYICGMCDKRYDGFKRLARHKSFCCRTLYCNLCPFTAKMPNVLKRHCQKWHFGPNRAMHNPCSKCGRQNRSYKTVATSGYCINCT